MAATSVRIRSRDQSHRPRLHPRLLGFNGMAIGVALAGQAANGALGIPSTITQRWHLLISRMLHIAATIGVTGDALRSGLPGSASSAVSIAMQLWRLS